jgi:hypothetical protein
MLILSRLQVEEPGMAIDAPGPEWSARWRCAGARDEGPDDPRATRRRPNEAGRAAVECLEHIRAEVAAEPTDRLDPSSGWPL